MNLLNILAMHFWETTIRKCICFCLCLWGKVNTHAQIVGSFWAISCLMYTQSIGNTNPQHMLVASYFERFFSSPDDKQWHCLKGGNTGKVFNSANTPLATITCSHISMGTNFFHSNLMIHQKPVVCFISANGFVYKFRICKHCTYDDL